MKKPYELGLLLGRFQMIHLGHSEMINKAVSLCKRVCIFVGSSQESGTAKNPFTYEMREDMLRSLFGDKIEIFPLPDIGVGNNSKWGDYVLGRSMELLGKYPDLIVSGKEERRSSWLESDIGDTVAELFVPKTINISASRMREFLIEDNRAQWEKYTDSRLHGKYAELRQCVLLSKDETNTQSI